MANTVVFYDERYPGKCTEEVVWKLVPGSYQLADAAHLAERLSAGSEGKGLLVSLHGPYFPKASWQAIVSFLERGGNLAIFGGMPFACPVNEDGEIEPEQDAYSRQIYLGPFFRVSWPEDGAGVAVRLVADEDAVLLRDCELTLGGDGVGDEAGDGAFWSFYPKLTQHSDHPEEMGSAGPSDTVLQPLIYMLAGSQHGERRIATPALLLDQRSGRFRGGRWLISAWQPASEEVWLANAEAIQRMILCAAEGATNFEVRPVLGCYQPGEMPEVVATVWTEVEVQARITVRALSKGATPQEVGGEVLQRWEMVFPALAVKQEESCRLGTLEEPGLYQIEVEYRRAGGEWLAQRSGFWVWDEALVEDTYKKRLTAGRDYFYQDDRPFLVYGTTYMDGRVQRKFLHLPNAARWDREMAEMKAAGINLLRTGIWTAWREMVPVAGSVNETFLRALDAFVMTACKHNLQVIFTFFAFFPPMFEGENPWLDPQSVEAQQDFVGTLARRYAQVELLSWDLINEPSFGDPQKIFAQRPLPNYDRFEIAAFQRWLAERYTLSELQLRWRQTPTDMPDWRHVLPPKAEGYETYVHSTTARAMLKVADYTHFSQEMFNGWAAQMVTAIRAGGGQTLIGVGQDEAGARIAPQFYGEVVDYTTTHPWWNIDDLLWDMLLDKTPEKPNLIQETGVMQLRDIDGRPWRSEQENAHLLERKLVTGLLARGAGLIQWLWHTNGYMTSDNENSIGLVRADGSAKPELAVMEEFGRLTGALAGRVLETPALPDVWVVIPYAEWFARPEWARYGTQQAVRALGYELGIVPQMVGEFQLEALTTHRPRVVIVPAVQLLSSQAWCMLLQYVQSGGRLLVNGVVGRDQHNLPFAAGVDGVIVMPPVPVARHEELGDSEGRRYRVTFADEKISYVKKAHNRVSNYQYGAGVLTWCGLPLELANELSVIAAIYRQVIQENAFSRDFLDESSQENLSQARTPTRGPATTRTPPPSLLEGEGQRSSSCLIGRQVLKGEGTLILVVSEAGHEQTILLDEGIEITVEANRAGGVVLENDGRVRTFGGVRVWGAWV